jgi:hypothetical protein
VGGAVGPRALQGDGDDVGAEDLQPVEGEGWAQDVAAEVLEPVALVLFDADLGVEVEAVDARLAPSRQERDAEVGLGRVVGGVGLGAAGARGGGEGLGEGELVVVEGVALAPVEQSVSASDDAREDLLDLGGARGRSGEEAALAVRVPSVGAVQSERMRGGDWSGGRTRSAA